MKHITLALTFIILCLISTNVCQAAFAVKAGSAHAVGSGTIGAEKSVAGNRFIKNTEHHKGAPLEKIVYIILAILPLGWLAMGINDDWDGYDWLISLILYIIGWLPGIVYTLIMMSKYY